nr:uncharacterized mitochondrial protein AtMg00810-like [Tanacetum cinerariifolium]
MKKPYSSHCFIANCFNAGNLKMEVKDVDEFTLSINPIDIIELLMGEKLGTNILALFSRGFILDSFKWEKKKTKEDYYLVKQVEWVVGRLSWELPIVNLQEDTWECRFFVMKRARKEKRQQKQSNVMKEKADIRKRLHLLKEDMDDISNHVKKHRARVLFIIFPNQERGVIRDSFKWEKKKTKEDYYLVKQEERVVGCLSWQLPIVNLQEDTWECRFYVMKWVLYFVLRPDIMFAVCACAMFQVTPKVSHLHVVKKIFRYLKGQPKLGLWYPRDSPFNLEAFPNSDYAGASLDRKSTTRGKDAWNGIKQHLIQVSAGGLKLTSDTSPSIWKKIIVNEASIRRDLRLDDAEGAACLPNDTIFEELARMGYEKPSQKLTFYKAFFSPQ